ncbi:MAG: metal ABC transporter permease [Desulfovibrionaceae bacterium]
MIELFSYTFIQHAIIAIILTSIACAIVGPLIVTNKIAFLTGGIAHTAYGGIGLALFFSLPILPVTLLFTLVCALIIAEITYRSKESTDITITALWTIGMACGVLLMDFSPNNYGDIMSFLFGSILTVTQEDLIFMAILDGIIILTVYLTYPYLLSISFDATFAQTRGVPVRYMYFLLITISTFTIIVLLNTAGLMMMLTLLVLPAGAALHCSSSLSSMMFFTGVFSFLSSCVGLFFSWHYNLSSGACIVLSSIIIYLFISAYFSLKNRCIA